MSSPYSKARTPGQPGPGPSTCTGRCTRNLSVMVLSFREPDGIAEAVTIRQHMRVESSVKRNAGGIVLGVVIAVIFATGPPWWWHYFSAPTSSLPLHAAGSAGPGAEPSPGSLDDVWFAQLASVPISAGSAQLQNVLVQVRREIPDARYLNSSDYASLRPGYWMVYYLGSFHNGNDALEYCAAHGRTDGNQCIGRFLSHDKSDMIYMCFPPAGSQTGDCYR